MHYCPNCHQELNGFAFHCPRCRKPVGELAVEGDLLAIWWLEIDSGRSEKYGIKALKRAGEFLNLAGIFPVRPDQNSEFIEFTAHTLSGNDASFRSKVSDVFAELQQASQEWEVE